MKKFINWLKSLFANVKKLSEKYIPIAVTVVQGIKKAIENGNLDITADVLKELIPGTIDDVLIARVVVFLKKQIPVWCDKLGIAQDALNQLSGEKWAEFTSGLAGDIASEISGGILNPEASAIDSKIYYDTNIKNAA